MQQPPKVIPVAMEPPSAPPYDQAQQQAYDPNQTAQEQSKLAEWWNWITLHRHAPGTYYERQQHYQPQQEYPTPSPYPRPPPYNPQQYQPYQPQDQAYPQAYPAYPQQYQAYPSGYGAYYGQNIQPYG